MSQFENRLNLTEFQTSIQALQQEISKVIIGQKSLIDLLIVALFSNGHVLIEGVPGIAKTLTAKLIAKCISTHFSRIQFTPDLMPSDVLGTSIFNFQSSSFEFKKGPIFSNLILIDEINRAPAKTQSALFEVMEERQITIDGQQYLMTAPFMVLATQNPIEQEGTYRLPEAQLDRFLFKIVVDYPSLEEETSIIERFHSEQMANPTKRVEAIISADQLAAFKNLLKDIRLERTLLEYIAQIVHQTRKHKDLYLGASPRASLALLQSSKTWAAMQGRDFVTPEDIQYLATSVLRHRIILSPEKEMEGGRPKEVIHKLFKVLRYRDNGEQQI